MPNTVVEGNSAGTTAIHVVAAVIWHPTRQDRFLITRRPADKHLGGLWELPGGKKEADETAHDGLVRELAEEVAIEVLVASPFIEVLHHYPEKSILLDVWQVTSFAGEPVAMEQQEMTWVDLDQLQNFAFPEADRPVLEAILARSESAAG